MVVGGSLPLVAAIAAEGRESENMCLTVEMIQKVQVYLDNAKHI